MLVYLLFANSVWAAFTDIKFGRYQIADTQWNVNACLNTTTCQIYSKQPGTAYKIPWYTGQLSWATGDYVRFLVNLNSNGQQNTTNPWMAVQFNSSGQLKATMGSGHIVNMGPDYFFFVGNDNNTGQLFSGTIGMNNTSGVTWTGTQNPTTAEVDAYANTNYSTTPLAPGQTATPPGPPAAPTPVYSSGITSAQQSRKTANLNGLLGHEANVTITGDGNDIYIQQASGKHYVDVTVNGNNNAATVLQTGQGYTGVQHYLEVGIIGSNNNVNIAQRDTNKTALVNVGGNYNTVGVNQKGTGNHYLNLSVIGNNHNAALVQDGSGSHAATVLLDGNQPWNFQLNQNGSTAQTYSLPHTMSDNSAVSGTCSAVGGCNLTVNQQ